MGWEYSEKTKQLFMNAVHGKPGTHLGEIENPDGMGEHGSIVCGDSMRFTFRVKRHPSDPTQDIITEAKYLTFGCTSAIASSEALCEIIERGSYTPIAALKIQNSDIVDYLQGLPEQKIHCSVMGAEALEAAVFNWAQRRGVDLKKLGVDIHDQETRRRKNCLQMLLNHRTVSQTQDPGTQPPDDSPNYQRHQGGRGLHFLPSCPRRASGHSGSGMGRTAGSRLQPGFIADPACGIAAK